MTDQVTTDHYRWLIEQITIKLKLYQTYKRLEIEYTRSGYLTTACDATNKTWASITAMSTEVCEHLASSEDLDYRVLIEALNEEDLPVLEAYLMDIPFFERNFCTRQ